MIFSICFGCSKEPSHWDGSYPQHMFWLKNKKINFLLCTLNLKAWLPFSFPGTSTGLDKQHFLDQIVNIFLPIFFNQHFGC